MLAEGGREIIAVPAIFCVAFILIGVLFDGIFLLLLALFCFILAAFFTFFFRDPERCIADGVVATADGKIREISEENGAIKISTFMNIHNVHVNRAPLDGVIKSVKHFPGKHVPAFKKDAETNEHVVTILETAIGDVKIIQIAGSFARRIVPYVKKDDNIKKCDRIGIIRFGSRVDLYLPKKGFSIVVKKKQKVKAGETSLGYY